MTDDQLQHIYVEEAGKVMHCSRSEYVAYFQADLGKVRIHYFLHSLSQIFMHLLCTRSTIMLTRAATISPSRQRSTPRNI